MFLSHSELGVCPFSVKWHQVAKVFVSLQRTQSDPTGTRGHGSPGARSFLYRPSEAERMPPDFQVCCPAEYLGTAAPWLWQAIAANHSNGDHVETVIELRFAPSSQQQLPSLIPQLPAVDGLETLGRSLMSLRRSIER